MVLIPSSMISDQAFYAVSIAVYFSYFLKAAAVELTLQCSDDEKCAVETICLL